MPAPLRMNAALALRVLAALACVLAAGPATAAAATRDFPRGFGWGVATSGFQTEAGGRPSNADPGSDWWRWTHDPANIAAGRVRPDRVERGPGHWRVWRRDLDLARGLGSRVFRLGIEWSRIFPRSTAAIGGDGPPTRADLRRLDRLADHAALRHYRAVLRGIRSRGMRPFVTLNHYTLPLWVHDPIAVRDGRPGPRGWLDRSTVREFRKYAAYLGWRLGDLVDVWTPLNEPMVVAAFGYVNVPGVLAGNFPPGVLDFGGAVDVVLNEVAANAAAYDELKRWDRRARVGVVQQLIAFTPADPAADAVAARHADRLFNRLFLDAAVRGIVDADVDGVVDPGERRPALAGKADFIGLNYYFRGRATALGAPVDARVPLLDFLYSAFYRTPSHPERPPCPTTCTAFGTEVYPQGFRQVLRTTGRYGLPVYVTENGLAGPDDERRAYIRDHLRALRASMRAGDVRVRGYLYWSLVDNFEWADGYAPRFGLYGYDADTLRRRARPSVRLVRRVFRTGRLPAGR